MTSFPIQIRQDDVVREMAEIQKKISEGLQRLSDVKDSDVDIGSTPKDVIYEREIWKLYHYHPAVDKKKLHPVPLLIIPPLINGYEVSDLQPGRSVVQNFLNEGMDVYLVNWGYPKRSDMYLTWDDYVCDFIDDAVDHVLEDAGVDKTSLFGLCQGGTMSACYSALVPEKVKNLVLTVTPIDFHAHKVEGKPHIGLLFEMGRSANVDLMRDAFGLIPADVLNVSFLMASPFTLMFGKYADIIDVFENRDALLNFLRMEKWLFGGPEVAGGAYQQLVKTFVQGNALVNGTLELDGRKVDLHNLTMPVLNCFAERDHLVPPGCSMGLTKFMKDNKNYKEFPIKTGHIGIYTGGASQKIMVPGVSEWLREMDKKAS